MANRFLQVSFEIEGEVQLARAFDFIGDELEDLREPLKETNRLLNATIKKTFSSQGSEIGEPWQALSPEYAAQKSADGFGGGILVRTGTMRTAFKSNITQLSLMIFNPTSYFAFHQSNAPRQKLPRRVMLKIDKTREFKIVEIFNRFLNKTLEDA